MGRWQLEASPHSGGHWSAKDVLHLQLSLVHAGFAHAFIASSRRSRGSPPAQAQAADDMEGRPHPPSPDLYGHEMPRRRSPAAGPPPWGAAQQAARPPPRGASTAPRPPPPRKHAREEGTCAAGHRASAQGRLIIFKGPGASQTLWAL